MEREQKEAENSLNLEPIKHLSPRLQRKLLKREQRQRKRFRSTGKPYPLVSAQSPFNGDKLSVPAGGSSLTTGRRLTLAIASLVMLMLLTFGLVGIAVATHAASWVVFPILFVLVLFASAAVIINIVFNRKP